MVAILSKPCEICGFQFSKPASCGRPEWSRRRFCSQACANVWKAGQPSKKKGRKFPTGRARYLPCRICGGDTRYHWAATVAARKLVRCEKPECIEASRALKNERIAARHRADYATGKRRKLRDNWKNAARVSAEELLLAPWFSDHGWTAQYGLTLGVSDIHLPRYFVLDFADVGNKLDVEIDGSVHRLKRDQDERRTRMLEERGWKVLRIDAREVRTDVEAAIAKISRWIAASTVLLD